jgi:magnesium transporter
LQLRARNSTDIGGLPLLLTTFLLFLSVSQTLVRALKVFAMSSNRFADLASTSKATPPASTSNQLQAPESSNNSNASKARKRKGHRGGRKKRTRRKSFAALDDDEHDEDREATGEGFFNLPRANLSNTSIDSEALLDHR